ncbi:hypothetical protein MY11210_009654 [Beauveria gryllotalpidicola]
MAFSAEQTAEAWKARVEASENYDIISDREETASGKDDQDELKKERKSKKKEAIEMKWREIRHRIEELDQERLVLAEEREAFREERRTFKNWKIMAVWQFSRAFTILGKKKTPSCAHRALDVASGLEAPNANAALSQSHEIVTWTKSNRPMTLIDEKMRKAVIIGADYEERHERSILPGLSSASRTDNNNTGCFNFEQGVRQRGQLRSHGAEQKPNLRNKVFHQVDMNSVGKADDGDTIYEASERRVITHSSPAFHTRPLAWVVCIVLLAVGAGMTAIACLHIHKAKAERDLWLEANGLTRAYLLANAPTGYVG